MAKHAVTLGLANDQELGSLPHWYQLAGVESESEARDVAGVRRVLDAHAAGYLGAATGNTFKENLAKLVELPMDWWFLARTRIVALRVDGTAAGVLVMGAHQRLWDHLATETVLDWGRAGMPGEPEAWPEDVKKFLTAVMSVDKLHLVAVAAEQRGRGHGRRLVKHGLAMAHAGRSVMLYGQLRGPDAATLAAFYSRLGFNVLAENQPLDVFMATGTIGDYMQPAPGERYFVKYLER